MLTNLKPTKGINCVFQQKWVQSHGFRSGQALMLWKCLYGSNVWAHSHDELEGLFLFLVLLKNMLLYHLFAEKLCHDEVIIYGSIHVYMVIALSA